MKHLLVFFSAWIATQTIYSQQFSGQLQSQLFSNKKNYEDTVWTIRGATPLDHKYKKWKLDLALDARQTLVSNTPARLAGLRVGAEYRRVHRFGFGIYTLGDGVRVSSLLEVSSDINDAEFTLAYSTLFYERVMYFGRKWEWSLTGHMGSGRITARYTMPGKSEPEEYFRRVNLLEGSSTLYFHLTYFISIGAGIGYRYMPDTPPEIRPVYNAPVSIFRVRVRLIKMVAGAFNKDIRTTY